MLMASDKAVETKEVTNPYSVLGVSENSSYEEIKRAYQKLLLKAWKLLNDQSSKAKCDRNLKEQKLSQDWPVSAEVDLDDMEYHEAMQTYSSDCRCDGEYIISEGDLESGQNIVCCSGCSLSIRVLYNMLSDEEA
ncbi:DPH4 homolog isoform X2 [Acropora millepora]|uniref:DPH4 homolog isoform X2 n=1 Tax=Acropora millepora TaxID=45264 RepID=UPI001CF51ABB|nr:DPH4 homolog isoform X2 [Acropora millepora]